MTLTLKYCLETILLGLNFSTRLIWSKQDMSLKLFSYHFCPWARQSRKDHIMVLGIFALNPLNTKIKLLSWRDLRKIGIWPWVDTLPPIQVQWPLGWNTHSIMKNSIAFTWENRKCSYDISSFLADLLQRFFQQICHAMFIIHYSHWEEVLTSRFQFLAHRFL